MDDEALRLDGDIENLLSNVRNNLSRAEFAAQGAVPPPAPSRQPLTFPDHVLFIDRIVVNTWKRRWTLKNRPLSSPPLTSPSSAPAPSPCRGLFTARQKKS